MVSSSLSDEFEEAIVCAANEGLKQQTGRQRVH